jgi:hypothetical protein
MQFSGTVISCSHQANLVHFSTVAAEHKLGRCISTARPHVFALIYCIPFSSHLEKNFATKKLKKQTKLIQKNLLRRSTGGEVVGGLLPPRQQGKAMDEPMSGC